MQEKYQDIIDRIKMIPKSSLPDDFASKIMENIEQKDKEHFFALRRRIHSLVRNAFAIPQTKEDCAFSFIVVGFFYFVAAMILLFFLKDVGKAFDLYNWLRLQPLLFTLVSFWLVLIGVVVWLKGGKAKFFAHIGSYIYISIFAIGGIVLSIGGRIGFVFAAILTLGAVLVGISLDAAVKNLERGEF